MSNLVRTAHFWTNFHQRRSISKDWKDKMFKKSVEAIHPKGLMRISKIGIGQLCLIENSLNSNNSYIILKIRVITKLPNSEQSYKGKVKTHKYINRQNQSTTGKQLNISIIDISNKP